MTFPTDNDSQARHPETDASLEAANDNASDLSRRRFISTTATGAALMCYASGVDEAEAVRETVAILKRADLAPLDVTGCGSLDERLEDGHDIPEEERALMQRALEENSVVVSQTTAFYD